MVETMDLDQNLLPSTVQALVLLSVSIDDIMSSNIHAGVMINDNHCHLGSGYSSKSSTIVM